MLAREVADRCIQQTGAARMSDRATEVALIAIVHADEDSRVWRRRIRDEYRQRHPECGSVFLLIVLPILVSLISQWLGKWLFKETAEVRGALRDQAASALG
jgi:hypothetical protein